MYFFLTKRLKMNSDKIQKNGSIKKDIIFDKIKNTLIKNINFAQIKYFVKITIT